MLLLKEITKQEVQKLIDAGFLRNTRVGYVNEKGYRIGYYKTKGCAKKRYIQDQYADQAKTL